ncbi:WG repeat-containing protein [Aliarcobacter thereius]|uniref:WG repeat-containing protein n=1 Tax=Aliarcobacter thereius TaxID=544718 RepID=UPI0010FD3497|nr:WG repeat-containing protein [Aliarcobacter thereius]TLT06618.1 WG repeat-containing protein [Aliarcobacter thereius]
MKNLSLVILIALLLSACSDKPPLPKLEGDKYGYVNKQQKFVIAPEFHEAKDFHNGYAVVVKNGFYGLINTQGEMVIEPQYTYSSSVSKQGTLIVSDDWGRSYLINLKNEKIIGDEYIYLWFLSDYIRVNYDYISFMKGNIRGLLDKNLKPIYQSERYFVTKIIDDNYFIIDDVENDSKYSQGLIDKSGKVILDANYKLVSRKDGLLYVEKDGKEGLANLNGEFVLDVKYQIIAGNFGYPAINFVKIDDKWGTVDQTGKYIIEPQYEDIDTYNEHGIAAIYKDRVWSLIDNKGNLLNSRIYEEISVGDSLIRAKNGKVYILIDPKTGEEIKSIIATTVGVFSDGYATIKKDKQTIGMINEKFEINYLPEGYGDINSFNQYFYTAVIKDGKYGLIDKSGKIIIEPKYDWLDYSSYGNDQHTVVARIDKKRFLIDLQDRVILDKDFSTIYSRGNNLYEVKLDNKIGMIRLDGSYLIAPEFDDIWESTRLYVVKKGNKYGLLNSDGATILAPIYDSIDADTAGYRVVLDGKHNLVNRKGEYLYPQFYDEIESIGRFDQLQRVKLNNKYGLLYMDKQILDISYDSITNAFDSNRGLLIIEKEGKFGLYKNTEEILPTQYDAIAPVKIKTPEIQDKPRESYPNRLVSTATIIWAGENRNQSNTKANEVLLFSKDNKYGLISADLDIHIEPKFDELELMARDVYKVRLDDKYALLDNQLNYLQPLEFDSLQAFEGAFIAQKNGKFGVITPNATLLDFVYDSIQTTLHGVVLVEQNNQFGLADIINNQLTPLEYDSIVFAPANDKETNDIWWKINPYLILTKQQEKQILVFSEPEKAAEWITKLIENPLLDESFETLSLAPLGLPQGKVEVTQQTYTGKTQMNLRIDKQGKNSNRVTILDVNYSLMRNELYYLEYYVAISSFNSRHLMNIKNGDKQSLIVNINEVDSRGRTGARYELYFDYQPQIDKFVLSRVYNIWVRENHYEDEEDEFEYIIHQLHSKKFQGITLDKFNANEVAEYLFYTNYEEEVKSGRLKIEKLENLYEGEK